MTGRPTICLSMIVKDEAHVIERCLASVRPHIDAWAIVDTGSSDGTPDLIQSLLGDLPGTLVHRPWVDFAHNRNEALDLSRALADYSLFIDADEVLEVRTPDPFGDLDADWYHWRVRLGSWELRRVGLARNALPFRWHHRLHEWLWCDEAHRPEELDTAGLDAIQDGARSRDPRKAERDALLLHQMRFDDPEDPRTVFYLGDIYRSLGEYELALAWYRKRVAMSDGDDDPYRWWAMFQVAVLLAHLGAPASEVIAAHHACWSYRPTKLESLHEIILTSIDIGDVDSALALTEVAATVPATDTAFLLDRALFDHRIPLLRAALHLRVGDPALGRRLASDLARQRDLPDGVRAEARRLLEDADADPVASGALVALDPGPGAGAPPTRLVHGGADRLATRHASMAAAWRAVGLEVTQVRSLDAAPLRWDRASLGERSSRWTPGKVARLDAHRAAVQHAADHGWEAVIVADDLVAPGPRFAATMAAIWRTLPADWSLVHLAPLPPGSDRRLPPGQVYRVQGTVGAAAYALHRRLFPLVLDLLAGARAPLEDTVGLLSSMLPVHAAAAPIVRGHAAPPG